MNRSQMCIANVQYKKPTVEGSKQGKGFLRYLTYRDGRYGHIKQEPGQERWHNRGLGQSITEIDRLCQQYKSDHVLAFTLVFNSNPELMAMVPVEQREAFVCELTETTLDKFFEARGIDSGIEFSYVLHHRESEDKQAPGLHDPHTHVILPGTVFDEGTGERAPLYFSRNKRENHIELLHQVTEGVMADLLDRYVGLDWEQRFDALEAIRDQQREVTLGEPHGGIIDDQQRTWPLWFGTRRTDEQTTAVGYYRSYPRDEKSPQTEFDADELALEFRPLAAGFDHERAERLAHGAGNFMQQHQDMLPNEMMGIIRYVGALSPDKQTAFFSPSPGPLTVAPPEPDQPYPTFSGPSLDF